MSFTLVPVVVCNAGLAPLGLINIGAKADYIRFTDDLFKDTDLDKGAYFGLEANTILLPFLYLGLEAGYANIDGSVGNVDTELTYIPMELNAKFAISPVGNIVMDIGGGVSANYAKLKGTVDDILVSEDDVLFGGQFFADINYTRSIFFIGINGKYQISEKGIKKYDVDLNNWRVGGQIGVTF
jgi:hypothetical protein